MVANAGNLILYLLIGAFALGTVVVLGGAIWGVVRAIKKGSKYRAFLIVLSLLCILIAAASWIFNMGWYRFILTFLLAPFIHAIIFFIVNFFMAPAAERSRSVKILNLFFCLTYLAMYLLFPDGGDHGPMYFFFGLVRNDVLSAVAMGVAFLAFAAHIALLVALITEGVRSKKKPDPVVDAIPAEAEETEGQEN